MKRYKYFKVKNECVQVVVRCRPMSKRELESTPKSFSSKERSTKDDMLGNEFKQVVDVYPSRGVIEIQNPGDINRENPKMFTYDAVYDHRYVYLGYLKRRLTYNKLLQINTTRYLRRSSSPTRF